MRARVRVRMVTYSGHCGGVRGHRTGERTAGQQETRTAGTAVQGTAGGQEDRTAGDSDGQGDSMTGDRERERETVRREDSRTGGLKRTSTVIVMQ